MELAAVDLGSNSFHMVVARLSEGRLEIVDRIKERVQIAAGLDAKRHLNEAAEARALACLERFGQRVRDLPPGAVRAVGTSTLRRARNGRSFARRASRLIGHPIDIVSGKEEARLIYLGVAHGVAEAPRGRRLVVDIGGGSTECIIGEGMDIVASDSLHLGCVELTLRFFRDGQIRREALKKAVISARLELEGIRRRYQALGFQRAIGSSGTVLGIAEVLRAEGWAKDEITTKGLRKLRKRVIEVGEIDRLEGALAGLKADRASVLPGGLAILLAVWDAFGIERMRPSPWALQEGVLHDLIGRIRHEDVRDHAIRTFAASYHVDEEQAARVERTALALFDQVAASWDLSGESARQLLGWAARIHEVGIAVAFAGYHKHGAYLAANVELAGFSREDQELLAVLVRTHRRRFDDELFAALPAARALLGQRLALVLRLAVRLNRARSPRPLPPLTARADGRALELVFPTEWLEAHPLTRADLDDEAAVLAAGGFTLTWR